MTCIGVRYTSRRIRSFDAFQRQRRGLKGLRRSLHVDTSLALMVAHGGAQLTRTPIMILTVFVGQIGSRIVA